MATLIPEDVIDNIRNHTNIVDVVSQYVQLKKSGRNLFGLCPFHEEKTPSFSVNEEKQIFHCFSCGRGGNVFKFLMDLKHISFPEAVAQVAAFDHIPLDNRYQVHHVNNVDPQVLALQKVYQQAQELYAHILMNTEMGEPALAYLHHRGMSDELIKTFGIGFAPDEQLLANYFQAKKTTPSTLQLSGLFADRNDDKLYDRFRNRIMFPIRDANGQTIAFSGRILAQQVPDNEPKYLNSPETRLFNKRKVLFNFDLAQPAIRQDKRVYLFEGFMDVIAAYGAGVKNGIASMGTSLTTEQLQLIKQTTHQLVICYDGDNPGLAAADRALNLLANEHRLQANVVVLPAKMDPDEFIHQQGAQAFQDIVHKSIQTRPAFKLFYLKHGLNLANEKDKIGYINQALRVIASLASPVERDVYLKQLVNETNVDESSLLAQLQTILQTQTQQQVHQQYQQRRTITTPVQQHQAHTLDRLERAEQSLLHVAFHDLHVTQQLYNQQFQFVHDEYQQIFMAWYHFITENETTWRFNENDCTAAFLDNADVALHDKISAIELLPWPATDVAPQVINDYIATIKNHAITQKLQQVKQQLTDAQRLGNEHDVVHLTSEYVHLMQLMKQK
ncbi:MAG: DNA primase [Candidatus Paralactobacillus gallistercoris]|uniref:DNA primase n=1 Tax=Candidatus Paralactobacillus gallistercoris TaxID=2838724 RepID=A0A948TIP6_9LACO|nr:DNA primase [Candidatus Paralactobacillus gallistercoris]